MHPLRFFSLQLDMLINPRGKPKNLYIYCSTCLEAVVDYDEIAKMLGMVKWRSSQFCVY